MSAWLDGCMAGWVEDWLRAGRRPSRIAEAAIGLLLKPTHGSHRSRGSHWSHLPLALAPHRAPVLLDPAARSARASALGEKIAALDAADYLQRRAARGSRARFRRALAKVPDTEPEPNDRRT